MLEFYGTQIHLTTKLESLACRTKWSTLNYPNQICQLKIPTCIEGAICCKIRYISFTVQLSLERAPDDLLVAGTPFLDAFERPLASRYCYFPERKVGRMERIPHSANQFHKFIHSDVWGRTPPSNGLSTFHILFCAHFQLFCSWFAKLLSALNSTR